MYHLLKVPFVTLITKQNDIPVKTQFPDQKQKEIAWKGKETEIYILRPES